MLQRNKVYRTLLRLPPTPFIELSVGRSIRKLCVNKTWNCKRHETLNRNERLASDSLKFRTHRQLLVPEFVTLNFDLYDRWLELQLCTINGRSIGIADKLGDRGHGERNGEEQRTKLHGPGDKAIENLKNSARKNGNETSTCFENYSKKTASWNLVHLRPYVLSNYLIANLRYKNWLQNFGWFFFNNNAREQLLSEKCLRLYRYKYFLVTTCL